MEVAGTIILVIGALICLAGHIMMLLAAHEHGPGWLLWSFLLPMVLWYLVITDFRRFWKSLAVCAGGISLIGLGCLFH